jgi:AcrR family transcriptional regulator
MQARSTAPTTADNAELQTRDRLLLAGATLLDESKGKPVSTRAVCERAGVQAPTLYHHFGSKEGLFNAVISHGFKQFLAERRATPSGDPIADIREGWDTHVRFGLEYPEFYALIYGRVRPGSPCAVIADVEAMILDALQPAAGRGQLRVSPQDAASHIVAASSGVTLALIQQPPEQRDLTLSERVRDGVLAAIAVAGDTSATPTKEGSVAAAAITLAANLDNAAVADALSPGEAGLLSELLARLGGAVTGTGAG